MRTRSGTEYTLKDEKDVEISHDLDRKSKRRRRRVKESPLTSPTLVPTPESELIPVPSNGIADYPQDHDDSSLLTPSNHNGSSLSSHQTLLSSTQHSTSYSFLKQLIRKRYPPSSETESSPLSPKSYLQLLRDSFFSDRLRSTLRKQSRLFDQLKATDEGSLDALSDREGDSLASGGEVCAPNGGALLGEKSFVTMRDRKSTDLKTRLAKPSSRTLRSSTKSKTAAAKVSHGNASMSDSNHMRRKLFITSSDSDPEISADEGRPPPPPPANGRSLRTSNGTKNSSPESGFEEGRFSTDSEQFVPGENFFLDSSFEEDVDPTWSTPRKIAASSRRLSLRRPHNHYIAYTSEPELVDWWSSDRTDYTYSASLSYRASTHQKKVGSPNMARRSLHGDRVVTKDTPVPEGFVLPSNYQQYLEQRRTQRRVVDDSSEDEGDFIFSPIQRTEHVTLPSPAERKSSQTTTSSTTVTRSVRYGLDYESDGEDFASTSRPRKSAVHHRAMPLITPASTAATPFVGYSPFKSNSELNDSSSVITRTTNSVTTIVSVISQSVRWLYHLPSLAAHSVSDASRTSVSENNNRDSSKNGTAKYHQTERVLRSGRKVYSYEVADDTNTSEESSHLNKGFMGSVGSSARMVTSTSLLYLLTLFSLFTSVLGKAYRKSSSGRFFGGLASRGKSMVSWSALSLGKKGEEVGEVELGKRRTRSQKVVERMLVEEEVEDKSGVALMWRLWWLLPLLLLLTALLLTGLQYLGVADSLPAPLPSTSLFLWQTSKQFSFALSNSALFAFNSLTSLSSWLFNTFSSLLSSLYAALWSILLTIQSTALTVGSSLWWVVTAPFSADLGEGFSKAISATEGLSKAASAAGAFVVGLPYRLWTAASSAVTVAGSSAGNAVAGISSGVWWILSTFWLGLVWFVNSLLLFPLLVWNSVTSALPLIGSGVTSFGGSLVAVLTFSGQTERNEAIYTTSTLSEESPLKSPGDVDSLVERLLQSEQLQHKLGEAVSSKIGASDAQIKQQQQQKTDQTLLLLQQLQLKHASLEEQIQQLNFSLLGLQAAGVEVKNRLSATEEKQNYAGKQQLLGIERTLLGMKEQISAIEAQQVSLGTDMLSCCNKHVLSMAEVESHVNKLIGSLVGFTGAEPSEGDLKAWMASYFVAKSLLDEKLEGLKTELKDTSIKESSLEEQSRQQSHELIMASVSEEIEKQLKDRLQSELKDIVEATVTEQLEGEVTAKMASIEENLMGKLSDVKSEVKEDVKSEIEVNLQDQIKNVVEPQLHTHIAMSVGEQVKESIQSGKEAEKIILHDEVMVAVKDVVPAVVQSTIASSALQPTVLNDTIKAIVRDFVTAYMSSSSSSAEDSGTVCNADSPNGCQSSSGIQSALFKAGGALSASAGINLSPSDGPEEDGSGVLSLKAVEKIIAAALKKYDADKTGLADHALESGGGTVVSTRCTEPYEVNQVQLSWLGIPFYRYSTNTPRSLIQPDRNPGQCWAFKGSQGYVVIRLVEPIRPTGFTLEHIPKELAPHGVIDSAPKDFSVWGLMSEDDDGILLGSYKYDDQGDALQYFPVGEVSQDYFPFVELKIGSNHGNMRYTCVYRLRVHGLRMRP